MEHHGTIWRGSVGEYSDSRWFSRQLPDGQQHHLET